LDLGRPQATTVGYANEGLTIYFLCGLDSQKAANLARDDRLSLTIDHDTPDMMEITGLSMAARAQVVVDQAEAEKALRLLMQKYPPQASLPLQMPTPDDVRIFRVTPAVISVLDYSKGFGHSDLVTC
jgi:nitroimidazol reductase NimA-like FMN-containing flavoprotein (pyridoxamine 5'-phosphate oxidase superfamily)